MPIELNAFARSGVLCRRHVVKGDLDEAVSRRSFRDEAFEGSGHAIVIEGLFEFKEAKPSTRRNTGCFGPDAWPAIFDRPAGWIAGAAFRPS